MSKVRNKVPKKLGRKFQASTAEALPSVAEEEAPEIDRKDTIMEMLTKMIGDDAEEYRDYITSDDADAVWEMVNMMPHRTKIIEYLEKLKERPNVDATDIPYYQSSVFLSPEMYPLIEMAEARKNSLVRTDEYKEGPEKCGKCLKNLLSSKTFNNRAFDEPQTTMYICGNCFNTWFK